MGAGKKAAAEAAAKKAASKCAANKTALPADAQKALCKIQTGDPRPNVRKPKPFENDGRGGTAMLPTTDSSGKAITYTEHTVNPRPPGGALDGQRIMTGSDGSTWYTSNHMTSWTQLN